MRLHLFARMRSDFELFGATWVVAAASAIHATVPPILDGVIAAPTQPARDLCPTFAHFSHHLLDKHALLGGDWLVVEVGLQVLVIALATLLGRSSLDGLRDAHPVVRAMKLNQ